MSERSYYGDPVLAEPVWTWEIPMYFFTGGLAGASAGLALAAGLAGNDKLARRAWLNAQAAIAANPLLLISDLGRPARFLNMLRMFKVTSPMSVGSWLLVAVGGSVPMAAIDAWTGLIPAGKYARRAAALFGLPLATYSAALISNTAIPIWHKAHRILPFVFASGAAMSAGAATVALTPPAAAAPARRLALAGAAAGLVHRDAGRPAQPRPVRAARRRRGHHLAVRAGGDQRRVRHGAAARHRYPATVHLGRRPWPLA